MPGAEAQPKPKPARDPQALTSEYHKARKQLMLWAGILFIWELVGIDLEKAKEAGGNAGAIITAIKSPQAVPWVLLILVAYFLFKTTVEWFQCSGSRRALRVSRIDFYSAWVTSVAAYTLYVYQAIKKVQFADTVQYSTSMAISEAVGTSIGATLMLFPLLVISQKYRQWKKDKTLSFEWKDLAPLMAIVIVAAVWFIVVKILGWSVSWAAFAKRVGLGALFVLLMGAIRVIGPRIYRALPTLRKNMKTEES